MDWQIAWAEPAAADLEEILNFHGSRNSTAMDRIANAIVQRVELLQTLPFMGRIFREGTQAPIRQTVTGNYRIFYRVLEAEMRVEILRVWHGRRGDPDLLEN